MKEPNDSTRVPPLLLGGLVAALGFATPTTIPAQVASQTITSPNEAALRAAIGDGGIINLAFDGRMLLSNTIVLERDITLDGSGHTVTISGNKAVRLFQVTPGVYVRFISLTLADGWHVGEYCFGIAGDGGPGYGGAIYNDGGTVDLLSCVLTNHAAKGGTASFPGFRAGDAFGGAVYNLAGVLNVINSAFSTNSATAGQPSQWVQAGGHGWGGAIYSQDGQVNLDSTQFSGNTAFGTSTAPLGGTSGYGYGGALHANGGTVVVHNSTFTLNQASGGHGIVNTDGSGGAICLTDALLICTNSQFLGNQAQGGVGDHYGSGNGLGGALFGQGEVNLSGCVFRGNSAVVPVHLNPGTADGNGIGGAVYAAGLLNVTACTFANNSAIGGAGTWIVGRGSFDGGLGLGGGIYIQGILHLTNSAFFGNVAKGGTGSSSASGAIDGGAGLGGGIYLASGSADLVNVTLATNSALGGNIHGSDPNLQAGPGLGGGFYQESGTARLLNVTLGANSAAGGTGAKVPPGTSVGGAIYNYGGTLWLGNSILAYSVSGFNAFGVLVDGGHNLSSDGSCHFTNIGSLNNTDPKLGLLATNGGPTMTMALLVGSPAIDAGDDTLAPAFDQRGLKRPQGAHADMGAFEYHEGAWVWQFTRATNGWQIRFNGRANANYVILRAGSLDGPWTPCGTVVAAKGLGLFVDPEPLAGTAFYRLKEE